MLRLRSHDELLAHSPHDPWIRWSLARPLRGEVWVHEDVALVERLGRRRGFWVVPLRSGMPSAPGDSWVAAAPGEDHASGSSSEPARVAAALTALRDGGHLDRLASQSVSVPQAHAAVAHEVLDLADGGDWDWMWTTRAPAAHPAEAEVVELDDLGDAAELEAFSRRHNPRVWTEIGTGRVHRWVGIRDADGALLAIGGAEAEESGIPHLAGIVTDAGHRGHGLGTAVTAHLTRWSVERHGACTLGMFSDNAAARSVYDRLGYRTAHAWHSRGLAGRDQLSA